MTIALSNLLDKVATPTLSVDGYRIISCLSSGRFALNSDNDLMDLVTSTQYTRDKSIQLDNVGWTDIPGLVASGEYITLSYLTALIYKPLLLPDSILLDQVNGPKVYVRNGMQTLKPEQAFWQYPVGGIESTDTGYMYIPGASNFTVNDMGMVRDVLTGTAVTPGTNRGNMILITTDQRDVIEVSAAALVLLAFGDYSPHNWQLAVKFKDGDDTNLARANLTLDPVEVTGKSVLVPDDADRIINN